MVERKDNKKTKKAGGKKKRFLVPRPYLFSESKVLSVINKNPECVFIRFIKNIRIGGKSYWFLSKNVQKEE